MNTIKTVVFDLGGVLVDLDIDRCTGAFRSLGMDAVADLINPYYPAEMIGRLEHGVISFHEACDEMRRLSGTPEITDAQIAWAYGQFLVRIPVAKLRQIDALRERGIRTCVLSNNNPASMKYIRRMFTADGKTMDDYFDAVFLSYELHELKPSEAIFRKMIAAGGMRPEETLFIDDGQKNVDAAQRLGFAVYMPGPGEDFGHILDNLNRYEEILENRAGRLMPPDATETAPSAGSASSASYAETAPPAESPPIRQRQEQNKATPPVAGPEGFPHFIHRLSE